MNLPNKLTMVRVFCVPVFIACYMLKWFIPALIIFIAASITDMLDGKLARKFDLVTNFGKIKTVLQMIAVIVPLVYLALNSVFPEAGPLLRILFLTGEVTLYAALVMTVVSGYSYVNNNREVFRQ